MIPKQLFFIWFGDLPDYAKYSIDSFKKMNPSFSVDLIHYSIKEVLDCNDTIVNYCKDFIFQTKNGIQNKYFEYIQYRIKSKFNFIQILSDIIRFEILYCYGGIYLDCDTFPVKPFDDKLLNCTNFSQSVLALKPKDVNVDNLHDDYTEIYDYKFENNLDKYFYYLYTDIYFIGAIKNYTDSDIKFSKCSVFSNQLMPPWLRNFDNDKCFLNYKKRFYNRKLKLFHDHIFYTHYLLHFPVRNWQKDYKKNKMYCELDDYIYGD